MGNKTHKVNETLRKQGRCRINTDIEKRVQENVKIATGISLHACKNSLRRIFSMGAKWTFLGFHKEMDSKV